MRSRWKGIYLDKVIYNFIKSNEKIYSIKWLKKKSNIRSNVIFPHFLGKTLLIHDGKQYHQRVIGRNFILYNKIGQHILTTLEVIHEKKDKKKRRIRALRKAQRKKK